MEKGIGSYFFVLMAISIEFACPSSTIRGEINSRVSIRQWNIAKQKGCNIYEGSWIYDDSYPLYDSSTCPFIRTEFDCLKYGRPDNQYLKYRWQPKQCNIPRFDGMDFLRRLKGKKIMFIGDSISLDHWESLLCLLHAAVPHSNIIHETNGTSVIFKDYGVSITLFHSNYLVDIENEQIGRVLKLDSLKDGDKWKQMDILIFNTWLWWYRRGIKQPWDYVQVDGKFLRDMDRMDAFRKGLTTWAKWVDSQVDPLKTTVFFQGISPTHYNGAEWNEPGVTNCSVEKTPLSCSTYPSGMPFASRVLNDVLSEICQPVYLLNITTLSQLRKDGHPGVHNVLGRMDCTHWCVAGVVDTWNQLLYANLIEE